MSEESSALSVTLKADGGYDAPWIVVRADTPEQLAARLNSVLNGDLASLASQAAVGFAAAYTTTKTLGARPVAPTYVAPSTDASQLPFAGPAANVVQFPTPPAPSDGLRTESDKWGNTYKWGVPGAPTCPHGVRVMKQGTQKNGAPYTAFICPQLDNFYRVQTDCKAQYS